jgi:hypothetical protein
MPIMSGSNTSVPAAKCDRSLLENAVKTYCSPGDIVRRAVFASEIFRPRGVLQNVIPAMKELVSFDTMGGTCIVCGQRISRGRCFCQLKYKGRIMTLCCPLCLEVFQINPGHYSGNLQGSQT